MSQDIDFEENLNRRSANCTGKDLQRKADTDLYIQHLNCSAHASSSLFRRATRRLEFAGAQNRLCHNK